MRAIVPVLIVAVGILNTYSYSIYGDGDSDCEWSCDSVDCIPESARCNGVPDCYDKSDEASCQNYPCEQKGRYRCKNRSRCVDRKYLCDGINHCPQGDDEDNCKTAATEEPPLCSRFEFTCADNKCIPAEQVCNGVKNCGDGLDEENCFIECDEEHGKFKCSDNSTCLDLSQTCDGKQHCRDGSDEGEPCKSTRCSSLNCPDGCKNIPHGAVCLCKAGFKFSKQSNSCEDVNECERYGICSQGCENTVGSFRCTCIDKFKLKNDGRSCELIDSVEPLLLYSSQKAIGALNLNTDHQHYLAENLSQAISVSYDGSHVYWTDISSEKQSIERTLENGTERELLRTYGQVSPEDLALDWLTGNIYFSDSAHPMIAVCSSKGFHCSELIQDKLHKPRSIALLPQKGTMFYSDWGHKAMIGTAQMDGTNNRYLIEENIHRPNGLAVDWSNGRLYWVDTKLKKIESVKLDGTQRVTILSDFLDYPFAISVFSDRVYWSDWKTKSIQSCDKFFGKDRKTLINDPDGQIFDLYIYHSAIHPKSDHPCIGNFCSHLCVLASNSTYSCVCPFGMSLRADKHSCRETEKLQFLLMGIGNYLVKLDVKTIGQREDIKLTDKYQFVFDRMAFNTLTGELFVADNHQKTIYTVDLKSRAFQKLVKSDIGNISALAFDYLGNNLYWTDSERSTLEIISLRTRHRAIIRHYLDTYFPVGLALISEIGKVFIALHSTSATPHTRIDRQSIIGSDPPDFAIEDRLSSDNGTITLVIDSDHEAIYWNDMDHGKIELTGYDRNTRQLFRESLHYPVSIAITDDHVFWTCLHSKQLYWSAKHEFEGNVKNTDISASWKKEAGLFPDEIVLLGTQPLKRSNHICQKQNGGCSHVCVATTGTGSATCICPSGMVFNSPKNKTCVYAIDCAIKCTNGECLAAISRRCDGHKDCLDGSDEKDCVVSRSTTLFSRRVVGVVMVIAVYLVL